VVNRLLRPRPLATLILEMKTRASWLDGFVKWFFNASPVWVDERDVVKEPFQDVPRNRRVHADRRRHVEARDGTQAADRRRSIP